MNREAIEHPFGPVYDSDSEVLILGSFPSVASRKQNFYYAHPQNRFWPLMAKLFHEEITDRKEFCLRHHIALWDVIESCTISGSSDASIRDVVPNRINELIAKTHIRAVFTTGSTASKLYERYIRCDAVHYALPSSSPANAKMRMDDLLKEYGRITEVLYEKT
jgi:hypoxanthine-DNA glycosylase